MPFLYWSRIAEFTTDRTGRLTCQDISYIDRYEVCRNIRKIQISPAYHHLTRSAEDFMNLNEESLNKVFRFFLDANPWFGMTPLWTLIHGAKLIKWQETRDYSHVFRQETFDPVTMGNIPNVAA